MVRKNLPAILVLIFLVSCGSQKKDVLKITNHSNKKVYVAIGRKNSKNKIISDGWYSFSRDESKTFEAESEHEQVYFLIHRDGKRLWYDFYPDLMTQRFLMTPNYTGDYSVSKTRFSEMVEISSGWFNEKNYMINEPVPSGWMWAEFYRHPKGKLEISILPNEKYHMTTAVN